MLVNTKHVFIKWERAGPDPITVTMQIISNGVVYCFDNTAIHWSKARKKNIFIFIMCAEQDYSFKKRKKLTKRVKIKQKLKALQLLLHIKVSGAAFSGNFKQQLINLIVYLVSAAGK